LARPTTSSVFVICFQKHVYFHLLPVSFLLYHFHVPKKRKIVRLKIRNFFRGSKKPSFDRLGLLISS